MLVYHKLKSKLYFNKLIDFLKHNTFVLFYHPKEDHGHTVDHMMGLINVSFGDKLSYPCVTHKNKFFLVKTGQLGKLAEMAHDKTHKITKSDNLGHNNSVDSANPMESTLATKSTNFLARKNDSQDSQTLVIIIKVLNLLIKNSTMANVLLIGFNSLEKTQDYISKSSHYSVSLGAIYKQSLISSKDCHKLSGLRRDKLSSQLINTIKGNPNKLTKTIIWPSFILSNSLKTP